MIMLILPTGADARNLFDSARVFPLTYAGNPVVVADVTGDGLLDVLTVRIRLSVMVGAGDGTFSEVHETIGVLSPVSMAVGDLNGDGLEDLAMGDDYGAGEGLIRVLLGNGDGTFYSNETFVSVSYPGYLDLGDLDGDGDLDVITTDRYGNTVVAHRNDGNGAFGPELHSQVGDQPMDGVLEDFSGDGILDLAVVNDDSEDLYVCLGNGDGTFSGSQVAVFGSTIRDMDGGDVNGDGTLDLVVTTHLSGPEPDLFVLLGNGSGGFTMFGQYSIGGYLGVFQLARMDGDPHLDLVIERDNDIEIMTGNGDGTFNEGMETAVSTIVTEVFELSDLDRDGDQDMIVPVVSQEAGMTVVLNRGDGVLQMAPELDWYGSVSWTETADIDQDGDLDVVMTHDSLSSTKVTSLLNTADGSFSLVEAWLEGQEGAAHHFSLGDLNADTIPDLAVSMLDQYYQGYVAILIGYGDGTYFSPSIVLNDDEVFQSHLWWVNGDAHLDLVAVCADGVWLMPGTGDGGFGDQVDIAAGDVPTLADAADLDGNGTLDLVVFNSEGNSFSALFGDGSGGFAPPVDYPADDAWLSLNLGDIDGDEDPDLVYSIDTNPVDMLCVRLNDGTGTFLGETVSSEGLNVGPVRLADVTADGLLDVVSANWHSFSVHPSLGDGGFGDVLRFSTLDSGVGLPAPGDYDEDGDLDMVVGTGFTGQYFRNTLSLGNLFAAGPGRGEDNPARVRTFTLAGTVQPVAEWQAYGVSRYGVNVALGELDGSEGLEALTGPGPGPMFGPHVRGFEDTGVPLPGVSFLAYGTNKWGVNVASGDLDADGYDEIVTGAGPGAVFGPHVRAWNWDGAGTPSPIPGISYFAYGTPKWGVNVACGDIDGDGYDEIITGAGPGAVYGPHVRGWNCDGGGAQSIPGVSFLAYGTNKYGVNVSCGDIDGDGIDEMVTGAGPGAVFGPHVRGWNWDGTGAAQAIPGVSFFAYDYIQWGANVSCGDLDGDGIDEILTGPGPGTSHEPRIRGWNYDGVALTAIDQIDFYGFDPAEVTHGVKPAGLRASRR